MKFKRYYFLNEKKEDLPPILDKLVSGIFDSYEFNKKMGTKKIKGYKLKSPAADRLERSEDLGKALKASKIEHNSELTGKGSIPVLNVEYEGIKYRFVFKPTSGGLSETTLNSTITELVPALLFNNSYSGSKDPKDIQNWLIKNLDKLKKDPAFLDKRDAKAGIDFINTFDTSSKFIEKMTNAYGLYKHLKEMNSLNPIKEVYWSYRKKPAGIDKNSPADIVVKNKNGDLLGISLKAGGAKTKEPLLNTYVNPVFDFFNKDPKKLKDELWNAVYSKDPLNFSKDYKITKNSDELAALAEFEKNDPKRYNSFYDENLGIIKTNIINMINKNPERFVDFIKEKILKMSDSVPMIILKMIGSNVEEVTDSNQLKDILPSTEKITASQGSAKQDIFVDLKTKNGIARMLLSIRTNKSGLQHKLGQDFNLAVKYNGLK